MRLDDRGVAGFFEDLPVLMFVLAGTAVLVFSGSMAAQAQGRDRLQLTLDAAAGSLADNLISRLCDDSRRGGVLCPTIESIDRKDLSSLAEELSGGLACSIGLVRLYPTFEWLNASGLVEGLPEDTGCAVRLFNAVDGEGLEIVLELRVVVWRA